MGLGFWLSEKMVYDETSGRLLSDSTWEYKPPTSQVGNLVVYTGANKGQPG